MTREHAKFIAARVPGAEVYAPLPYGSDFQVRLALGGGSSLYLASQIYLATGPSRTTQKRIDNGVAKLKSAIAAAKAAGFGEQTGKVADDERA